MGRATRWLRNLLGVGGGGKKENREQKGSRLLGISEEKKRWSFKSARDSAAEANESRGVSVDSTASWLRSSSSSFYSESEKEQNKHAIAVAAATAAAADAAVAAAQAAVVVVRLTSHRRGAAAFGGAQEVVLAAVKIQTVFRGYLAKKALRALKALVKLQALVRGYLVRKQAAATLHSMQALIRAQATILKTHNYHHLPPSNDRRFLPEIRPRNSLERFDDARGKHSGSFHNGYDRSPKIVEMDTYRPKSSRRRNPSLVDSTEYITVNSISSPLQCQTPARITIPDCQNFQDYDWCLSGNKLRYSFTAQNTPRCMNSTRFAPPTPAKSVSAADGAFRRFLNLPNCPNYMANTRSSEAKVRSQSAPKQRLELTGGSRKRQPLSEVMIETRASLSGVGMRKSCSRAKEAVFNFKSAVLDRLDRSLELGTREPDTGSYLRTKC